MNVAETTVSRAEDLLMEWSAVYADRDARVLIAFRSRVPKARIAALTGLARSTVDRIVSDHAGDGRPG